MVVEEREALHTCMYVALSCIDTGEILSGHLRAQSTLNKLQLTFILHACTATV